MKTYCVCVWPSTFAYNFIHYSYWKYLPGTINLLCRQIISLQRALIQTHELCSQTAQELMWDLSVSETHTVAQILSSYKEIKSPSSRWYRAIGSLFLTENSWPLWPGEDGNQALRKTEKPFSLAPSSQLWGSWPIVQNHHLLFALNFRSKAVISQLSPPTLLFYIIFF